MSKQEQGLEMTPRQKLSPDEVLKIIKKFNDDRLRGDEHPEYFTIHLKNSVIHLPKWKHLLHKDGGETDIENEIEDVLNQN